MIDTRELGSSGVRVTRFALGSAPQDVASYGDRLLDLFGPERLMFGSDWPVCTLAASYAEVLDLARSVLAPLSAAEQEAVLAGTARRFYGLGGEAG